MCQLEFIDEIGQQNSWVYSRWRSSVIGYSRFKSRLAAVITLPTIRHSRYSGSVSNTSQLNHGEIQPGDMVRVRSEDEIRMTLDRSGRTRGCLFTRGMNDHCGKQYRVFKRVDHFFDETKLRMCKCNNLFLLEGAHCSRTTCDRSCFYFWHVSWLKKLDSNISPTTGCS